MLPGQPCRTRKQMSQSESHKLENKQTKGVIEKDTASVSLPVAWERAIAGPQSDISKHALFSHGVQMSQDTVGM